MHHIPKLKRNAGEENKLKYSPLKGDAYKMEDAEIKTVRKTWYVQIPDNTSDSLLLLRKHAELD